MKHPWSEAAELQKSGTSFVIVTMTGSKGHAPQDPGAKALITQDGLYAGTVGGGKVEAKCIELAKQMLAEPGPSAPETFHWNLQRDVGMTCGGEVTFLFEKIESQSWRVVVFGAGHVAQKMARLLRMLDCRATFIDSRAEWVSRFPKTSNLQYVCIPESKDYIDSLLQEQGVQPFFVIMTRGHATDLPVLRAIYEKFPNAPYIGVIGSKVKGIKMRTEMKAEGYPEALVNQLRCPMGLPLGTNDPAEIAISIVSEMIQVRDLLKNRNTELGQKSLISS